MVALILTRAGFEDMRLRIDPGRDAIGVGADVLTAEEVAALRGLGVNLTIFAHRLDPEHLDAPTVRGEAHSDQHHAVLARARPRR
jgi:hypothetical protein